MGGGTPDGGGWGVGWAHMLCVPDIVGWVIVSAWLDVIPVMGIMPGIMAPGTPPEGMVIILTTG